MSRVTRSSPQKRGWDRDDDSSPDPLANDEIHELNEPVRSPVTVTRGRKRTTSKARSTSRTSRASTKLSSSSRGRRTSRSSKTSSRTQSSSPVKASRLQTVVDDEQEVEEEGDDSDDRGPRSPPKVTESIRISDPTPYISGSGAASEPVIETESPTRDPTEDERKDTIELAKNVTSPAPKLAEDLDAEADDVPVDASVNPLDILAMAAHGVSGGDLGGKLDAEGELNAEGEIDAEGEMDAEGELDAEGEVDAEGELDAEGEPDVEETPKTGIDLKEHSNPVVEEDLDAEGETDMEVDTLAVTQTEKVDVGLDSMASIGIIEARESGNATEAIMAAGSAVTEKAEEVSKPVGSMGETENVEKVEHTEEAQQDENIAEAEVPEQRRQPEQAENTDKVEEAVQTDEMGVAGSNKGIEKVTKTEIAKESEQMTQTEEVEQVEPPHPEPKIMELDDIQPRPASESASALPILAGSDVQMEATGDGGQSSEIIGKSAKQKESEAAESAFLQPSLPSEGDATVVADDADGNDVAAGHVPPSGDLSSRERADLLSANNDDDATASISAMPVDLLPQVPVDSGQAATVPHIATTAPVPTVSMTDKQRRKELPEPPIPMGRVSARTLDRVIRQSVEEASVIPVLPEAKVVKPEPEQAAIPQIAEPPAHVSDVQPIAGSSKSKAPVVQMGSMSERQFARFMRQQQEETQTSSSSKRATDSVDRDEPGGSETKPGKKRKVGSSKTILAKDAGIQDHEDVQPGVNDGIDVDILDALEGSPAANPSKGRQKQKSKVKEKGKKNAIIPDAEPEAVEPDVAIMEMGDDQSVFSEDIREKKKGGRRNVKVSSPTPSIAAPPGPVAGTSKKTANGNEQGDDEVYCLCKRPYNEYDGQEMIQCDGCGGWYHPECVGLDSKLVPLVGFYSCPECDKDPSISWSTTFLEKCLRSACLLPRKEPLSKYCSDACGVHHMILTMEEQQVEDDQIMQYVKDARQPEAHIQDHSTHTQGERIGCASAAKSRQDAQLREDQQILLERRDLLAERLRLAEHKIGLLDAAIKTAEALPDLEVLPEDTADAPKKKGKKPSKAKPGPSAEDRRPCGFDERLLVDAMETADDDRTDTPGSGVQLRSVCVQPKRKCTRHTGWQKVRSVALEMEQTSLREEAMRLAGRIRT